MFFVVFAMVHASLKTVMIEEMFKSYFFAQLWLKMNNSGCLLREYLHLGDDHWFRVDSPPSIGESSKNMLKKCFCVDKWMQKRKSTNLHFSAVNPKNADENIAFVVWALWFQMNLFANTKQQNVKRLLKINFVLEVISPIVDDFSINSCSENIFSQQIRFLHGSFSALIFSFPNGTV